MTNPNTLAETSPRVSIIKTHSELRHPVGKTIAPDTEYRARYIRDGERAYWCVVDYTDSRAFYAVATGQRIDNRDCRVIYI